MAAVRQRAIVGKLKKFPVGIQRVFALSTSFSSADQEWSLFYPFENEEDDETCEEDKNNVRKPANESMRGKLSQTYPQWKVMCDFQKLHSLRTRKRFNKRKIYIVPIGTMNEETAINKALKEYEQNSLTSTRTCSSLFDIVVTFASLFFYGMEIKLLPFLNIEHLDVETRIHSRTNEKQVLVGDILNYLKKIKPKDCFCVVGWSSLDLYPSPELNFVLGEACFDSGCAVISFGHYSTVTDPKISYDNVENRLSPEKDTPQIDEQPALISCSSFVPSQTMSNGHVSSTPVNCHAGGHVFDMKDLGNEVVWRILKVLTHEVCHVLGMHHCTFFACLMNESSNVHQAQHQPLFLCPVCLRKLQKFLHFSVLTRYHALKGFMEHYCQIVRTTTPEVSHPCHCQDSFEELCRHASVNDGLKIMVKNVDSLKESPNMYTLYKFENCLTWLKNVLSYINCYNK